MSDALERLKNRSRPSVPSRDASLTPSAFAHQDISISRNLDSQKSASAETQQPLQTKQTTLRLEQGIGDQLQDFCREHAICREVLIEAMFEYCEANSDALQVVLSKAKSKNGHRQQMANQKRARSMMQRFGQGES